MPTKPSTLISPFIPADDFARQLSHDELAYLVDASAASGRVVLASVAVDGAHALRQSLGDVQMAALVRELAIYIRRILRGSDALSIVGDELLILLDAPSSVAVAIAERILSSARAHVFMSGTSAASRRITLTAGVAGSPEHGTTFLSLATNARQSRSSNIDDSVAGAFAVGSLPLNYNRFTGRAEPLASLIAHLDHTVRGVGHVVAVIGDTGVGASTLVRTLEPEMRLRGGSMVAGTCYERTLPSPYSLWSDVLRAVRRLPVKTTRLWRDLPLLDSTLEHASDAALLGSSKTRLLEELADFFRLAAQQRPLVLLLENMQWCDDASWDALEYLITQLERERILIAITMQSGQGAGVALERWSRIASRPRHVDIQLTYLTRDDVKRWLEATLRTADVTREVMSYVYRHSEGRPLVLTHLVRDLIESGHLARDGDTWQWSAIPDLPATGSLDELLSRRLTRLAAEPRAVLEMAAVLRREADDGVLTLEIGGGGKDPIRTLLDDGFLVTTFDRGRAAYVIAHAEIARVVRSRLPAERAAELHDSVARALASDPTSNSAEIAEHFERAGNKMLAHHHALAAADRAVLVHETAAVAELLAAAERTAPSDAALAEVRVRMVTVAEMAGRYEEAAALCDGALAWYESQGEQLQALKLKRTRALVRLKRGQGASEILTELLALEAEASAVSADMERAAVLLLIAQLQYRLGNSSEAQRLAAEAVGIAELGDDPLLLADASNRFAVTIQLVNAPHARELFNRSLEIARSLGDTSRIVRALNNLGVLEMINNNLDESRSALTTAIDLARASGMLEWWGRAELNRGVLAGRTGDYEDASRAFSEALRLAAMGQNSEEQLWATVNLAHLERDHGRFSVAADTYSLVVDLAERIGQASVQAAAEAGYGLCRRALGDREAARQALERSLALTSAIDEWFQGRELVTALRLHSMIEEGRTEAAVTLLEESVALADVVDVSGSAFLIAEVGKLLEPYAPEMIRAAVARYSTLPDVVQNAKMRARFTVLKGDSEVPIDETSGLGSF